MRRNIIHPGAKELTYEIREIVTTAKKIEKIGQKMTWENIGDPLTAGETLPQWLKNIVQEETKDDASYAYCPTKGVLATREYIVDERKKEGVNLSVEDILFFNGLGDAIATTYFYIEKHARVIGPDPAYPAHSSAESARAGDKHITYKLDPENNWIPDLEDLENKIKFNDSIAGLLLINPGNPVSVVYSKEILEKIISLVKKYDLFIISDEVYANLAHEPENFTPLYKILGDVPALIMKGLSKEIPWPGSRCGWIEFYNRDKDENFNEFSESIMNAKMLEVCATTLPQRALPTILQSPGYAGYTKSRIEKYKKRANFAFNIFSSNNSLLAPKPTGAFYYTVVFKKGLLNNLQKLNIENSEILNIVEEETSKNISLDKRFVYYLLGATGIVTVPLSGFHSEELGFRITLLQEDEEKFEWIINTINKKINEYLES